MHTWTYRRNKKIRFYLHSSIAKKTLAACMLHNIDIAVISECLYHLKAQYPVQYPDICSAFYILTTQRQQRVDCAFYALSFERHTNSFAAIENNSMRFCISLTRI